MQDMTKAIVIGGSRGMGKAIANSLESIGYEVIATSKNKLDTSNLQNVKDFVEEQKETDVLIFEYRRASCKRIFLSY